MPPPLEPNPYAPPAPAPPGFAEPALPAGGSSTPTPYADERRNVALMALLCVVTCGLYPAIWYVARAPFLDSLAADRKVGHLPKFYGAVYVIYIVLSFARVEPEVVRAAQLAAGISSVLLAFRVARMLRSDFARTGRFLDVSGLGTFFFGCLYLQHMINEAADTPPRVRG